MVESSPFPAVYGIHNQPLVVVFVERSHEHHHDNCLLQESYLPEYVKYPTTKNDNDSPTGQMCCVIC